MSFPDPTSRRRRTRRPTGGWSALALAAALGTGCNGIEPAAEAGGDRKGRRPNLLLITVDTLRADHLSAWGYPRATSPRIDRLASEGVRFAAAQVQWPKTGPSFASMFTSTYPKDNHNVRQIGIPLPCTFTTVAERLQRAGYQTLAVVANGALAREFNFDQGFDSYLEAWQEPHPDGGDPVRAENVTRLAIDLVETIDGERPWFLWVHYIDPHFPYRAPKATDRFRGDEVYRGDERRIRILDKYSHQMSAIGRRQTLDGSDRLADYVARYDAEIAYADEQIGGLLDRLDADGLLAHTLTAFTSDHGESLGEHEYFFDHGRFGFQTCLHVPLVLHWPDRIPARVEEAPVELIDLAPTFLEAAGLLEPGGEWAQGASLWPVLRGEKVPDSPAFAEAGTAIRGQWIKVARDGRFKLHHVRSGGDQRWVGGPGVDLVLYDLVDDPGETTNIASEHPDVARRLKRDLWRWWNRPDFDVHTDEQVECGAGREVEADTTEQLRALGYL